MRRCDLTGSAKSNMASAKTEVLEYQFPDHVLIENIQTTWFMCRVVNWAKCGLIQYLDSAIVQHSPRDVIARKLFITRHFLGCQKLSQDVFVEPNWIKSLILEIYKSFRWGKNLYDHFNSLFNNRNEVTTNRPIRLIKDEKTRLTEVTTL